MTSTPIRAWFPAPSVAAGLAQASQQWPARSRVSDGIIGDASHAAEISDHNPDQIGATGVPDHRANAVGMVHAFDLTHDPAHGVDTVALAELIRGRQDHRVRYVIAHRRIFLGPWAGSVQRGESRPWTWAAYDGADPHTSHMHVSVGYDPAAENDTAAWFAAGRRIVEPTIAAGDRSKVVALLQAKLGLPADGIFGPVTVLAVKAWQAHHGLTADGIVGPQTWAAL